jgi:plastocyanin
MRRAATTTAVVMLLAMVLPACGGGGANDDGNGEERTVLVDFRHDQVAAAFLQYYPEHLTVRPGDTIQFRQAWTGEPHSVTFGSIVDDFVDIFDEFEQYPTIEDAKAAGEPQELIDKAVTSYSKLPAMTDGFQPTRAGSQPCYVDDVEDAPVMRDVDTDAVDPDVECPTKGRKQPEFTGRQALYNSGFIPYSGQRGNSFTVPIADDAEPGTYRYFCNYHFIFMGGEVEIVDAGKPIPSQAEVSRQARKELDEDAAKALAKVREVAGLDVGDQVQVEVPTDDTPEVRSLTLPIAGRWIDDDTYVIINEFLPRKVQAKVGQKVTWTLDGSLHTVSFNVPKYFPIFTVDDDGEVHWDKRAYEPRGFDIDHEIPEFGEDAPSAEIDVGKWDGRGGFHSSGGLVPGDTFSITFTRTGTYPFACVLHPQMVGTLQVTG